MELNEFHGKIKFSSSQLDKLAQLDQNTEILNYKHFTLDQFKKLFDRKTKEFFNKKASAKWITNKILQPLTFLQSDLREQYVNACKCGNLVQLDNGEMQTFRCKTRFCVECNRIRTGKLINRYLPVITKWKDKHFITLTVPNVKQEELKDTIDKMQKNLSLIQRQIKREEMISQRLEMIKKLEITYNFKTKTFHPHFHIITKDEEQAYEIKYYWLKRFKKAKCEAQDIRKADDNTAKELFKYFTKFWKFDFTNKKIELYSPEVLDAIFNALKGRRIVQNVGFKAIEYSDYTGATNDEMYIHLKEAADILTEQYQIIDKKGKGIEKTMYNTGYYVYSYKLKDWVDKNTGELLSGYKAPENTTEWFIQNLSESDHYQLIDYSPDNHYINLVKEIRYKNTINNEIRKRQNEWAQFRMRKENKPTNKPDTKQILLNLQQGSKKQCFSMLKNRMPKEVPKKIQN